MKINSTQGINAYTAVQQPLANGQENMAARNQPPETEPAARPQEAAVVEITQAARDQMAQETAATAQAAGTAQTTETAQAAGTAQTTETAQATGTEPPQPAATAQTPGEQQQGNPMINIVA